MVDELYSISVGRRDRNFVCFSICQNDQGVSNIPRFTFRLVIRATNGRMTEFIFMVFPAFVSL